MKIWTELEIEHLLKSNDKFVIKCLCKLKELDLLHLNDFIQSVYNFYINRGFVTSKQIMALRKTFIGETEIIIFTKIANKQEIEFDDLYVRDWKAKNLYYLEKQYLNDYCNFSNDEDFLTIGG